MKFSVIMPVHLSPYQVDGIKSASNPEEKFIRSVNSFLLQSFVDAELVIISDGCDIAERIYNKNFSNDATIKFRKIEKQSLFSGTVRQTGLKMAEGDIVCYLDHDDFIGVDHLKIINDNFDTKKYDWVYFNDFVAVSNNGGGIAFTERNVSLNLFYIGTSAIAHKRGVPVFWGDGYAHDWRMIENSLLHYQVNKIPPGQYYVCHFHPNDF